MDWWRAIAQTREPDATVPGHSERWILADRKETARCADSGNGDGTFYDAHAQGGSVFLQRMVGPDDPKLHTHPFECIVHVLEGGFVEIATEFLQPLPRRGDPVLRGYEGWHAQLDRRVFSVGQTAKFPLQHVHYVEEITSPEIWALVVAGPRVRPWGTFEDGEYVEDPAELDV